MSNKIVYIMQRAFLNINRACACTCLTSVYEFLIESSVGPSVRCRLVSIYTNEFIRIDEYWRETIKRLFNNAQCTHTHSRQLSRFWWTVRKSHCRQTKASKLASGACNRLSPIPPIPMVVSFTLASHMLNTVTCCLLSSCWISVESNRQ